MNKYNHKTWSCVCVCVTMMSAGINKCHNRTFNGYSDKIISEYSLSHHHHRLNWRAFREFSPKLYKIFPLFQLLTHYLQYQIALPYFNIKWLSSLAYVYWVKFQSNYVSCCWLYDFWGKKMKAERNTTTTINVNKYVQSVWIMTIRNFQRKQHILSLIRRKTVRRHKINKQKQQTQ